MKHLLQETRSFLYVTCILTTLLFAGGCTKKDPPEPKLQVSVIATGLIAPIGLETDKDGRVWVAESGTGHDDGKVSVIMPDGKKMDAITGLASAFNEGGELEGPAHLLFADGLLYILAGHGKLYKANESSLKPGFSTLKASSLGVEEIAAFVLGKKFAESHPYNLTTGPGGNIYIADAAANAIIKREKNGVLSVFATIPGITNPTPVGPPKIDGVPTGIYYDGQNFLVTTLTGFPFLPGKAIIYKVTPAGVVSIYQQGFTSLVDIAKGGTLGRLVVEHGVFGAMGFAPKTGRLVWADGTTIKPLTDGLNMPAGITQANEHTWYVTSVSDGSVLKVMY